MQLPGKKSKTFLMRMEWHNPLLFNYGTKLRSMTRLIISTSALLFIISICVGYFISFTNLCGRFPKYILLEPPKEIAAVMKIRIYTFRARENRSET